MRGSRGDRETRRGGGGLQTSLLENSNFLKLLPKNGLGPPPLQQTKLFPVTHSLFFEEKNVNLRDSNFQNHHLQHTCNRIITLFVELRHTNGGLFME